MLALLEARLEVILPPKILLHFVETSSKKDDNEVENFGWK